MAERKDRAWLYSVPPIDFDALVRGAWKAPHRPTIGELAERKKARARAKRKRVAEAARKAQERRKAERAAKGPQPAIAWRIARAMEPGRWYGRPDILAASGLPYGHVKMVTQRMWRRGELERAQNPEWKPVFYPKGRGIDTVEGFRGRPPQWLYRLTAEGEVLRATPEDCACAGVSRRSDVKGEVCEKRGRKREAEGSEGEG